MKMNIADALDELDLDNDEHWTSDGLPRLDAVEEYLGRKTTRKEVKEAAPHFTRDNPQLAQVIDPETQGDVEVAGPSPMVGEDTAQAGEAIPAPIPAADGAKGEDLRPESQKLDEAANDLTVEIAKLQAERSRLQAAASQAHTIEAKDRDPQANQKELMRYISSQKDQRMARAQERQRVKELLGQAPASGGFSPLDQALNARKPKAGTTRPDYSKRPAMNSEGAS
jgi:hypothetical protein